MQPLAKSIWVDGRIVPWETARVHVMSHTLHYGVGVFEGVRCYAQSKGAPAIFRLEEHVDRLRDSARCVGMELPFDRAEIARDNRQLRIAKAKLATDQAMLNALLAQKNTRFRRVAWGRVNSLNVKIAKAQAVVNADNALISQLQAKKAADIAELASDMPRISFHR